MMKRYTAAKTREETGYNDASYRCNNWLCEV